MLTIDNIDLSKTKIPNLINKEVDEFKKIIEANIHSKTGLHLISYVEKKDKYLDFYIRAKTKKKLNLVKIDVLDDDVYMEEYFNEFLDNTIIPEVNETIKNILYLSKLEKINKEMFEND